MADSLKIGDWFALFCAPFALCDYSIAQGDPGLKSVEESSYANTGTQEAPRGRLEVSNPLWARWVKLSVLRVLFPDHHMGMDAEFMGGQYLKTESKIDTSENEDLLILFPSCECKGGSLKLELAGRKAMTFPTTSSCENIAISV